MAFLLPNRVTASADPALARNKISIAPEPPQSLHSARCPRSIQLAHILRHQPPWISAIDQQKVSSNHHGINLSSSAVDDESSCRKARAIVWRRDAFAYDRSLGFASIIGSQDGRRLKENSVGRGVQGRAEWILDFELFGGIRHDICSVPVLRGEQGMRLVKNIAHKGLMRLFQSTAPGLGLFYNIFLGIG